MASYPVPVITTSMLKVVMPLMLGETLNVSVAAITEPASNMVFSLSHVRVMGPFALVGFQSVVVMVRVMGAVPMFFT